MPECGVRCTWIVPRQTGDRATKTDARAITTRSAATAVASKVRARELPGEHASCPGALAAQFGHGGRLPAAAAGDRAERQQSGCGLAVRPDQPEVRGHLESKSERVRTSEALAQRA